MNRERLEILANRLDLEASNPEPVNFDMWVWAGSNAKLNEDGGLEPNCGTACCAAGLATTIKSLNQDGLKLYYHSGIDRYDVAYGYYTGATAVGKFFDMDRRDVENIFYPQGYVPDAYNVPDHGIVQPKHVAEKIRELLAKE